MITLTCTKCQTVMEMDDAFAGGVCRCQHCGTIQTVPSNAARNAARAGNPVRAGGQKALYSGGRGSGGSAIPSSGLDDLANAVASSGLSSGLANQRSASPSSSSKSGRQGATVDYARPGTSKPPASKLPLLIGLAVVLLAAGAAAFWFLGSRPAANVGPIPPGGANGTGAPGIIAAPGANNPAISGPQFVGVPLDYNKVVFVIDRGQSGAASFDPLKFALFDAVKSLGPQREFQVLFWTSPGGGDVDEYAYPKGSLARGNDDRVTNLKRSLEDVSTIGSSEVGPALKAAFDRNPDAIVITTAKGFSLDDSFAKQVAEVRGTRSTVIHTVDLTTDGDGRAVLEAVAHAAGGHYVHVPPAKLK